MLSAPDYPWHLEFNLLYFGAPQMEVSQIVAVRVWLPARPPISRTSVMSYGHPAPPSFRKFVFTLDGRGIMSGLQVQAVHVT